MEIYSKEQGGGGSVGGKWLRRGDIRVRGALLDQLNRTLAEGQLGWGMKNLIRY